MIVQNAAKINMTETSVSMPTKANATSKQPEWDSSQRLGQKSQCLGEKSHGLGTILTDVDSGLTFVLTPGPVPATVGRRVGVLLCRWVVATRDG